MKVSKVFLLLSIAVIFLLLWAMTSGAEETKTIFKRVVIPKPDVNLRTGPGIKYPTIPWHSKAVKGDTFDLVGTEVEGDWIPFIAGWKGNRVTISYVHRKLAKIEVVKIEVPVKPEEKTVAEPRRYLRLIPIVIVFLIVALGGIAVILFRKKQLGKKKGT